MPITFDYICAIYNPNSTNDAKTKALSFQKQAKLAGCAVALVPTTHQGHAFEIAQDIVARYKQPLLISVSGDGGYNELINGIMKTSERIAKKPVVAIIAAGNANDHKRTTRGDTPLLKLIQQGTPRPLDLLHISAGELSRYAHSYIGFGITPEVGVELNKHDLSPLVEIKLVLKTFMKFSPFAIKRGGNVQRYSNLLFANVGSMSKVLTLDPDASDISDGKFEMIADEWHGKLRLLAHLLKLVFRGHPDAAQFASYSFTTQDAVTPVQLDGEIEEIAKDTDVVIVAKHGAILSLY
jgi:diacylglycerol kinase (ATP)